MSTVQQAIEVGAPLHAVYERLASFEDYPRFMTGVERVTRLADDRTHWVMDLDGKRREFDARIIERSPDRRVSWQATDGPMLAESITLRPLGETRTQVVAQLEADVAALMPNERHAQETLSRRLKADLAGLKRLIEHESGFVRAAGGAATGSGEGTMSGLADLASPASVAARIARSRPTSGHRATPAAAEPEPAAMPEIDREPPVMSDADTEERGSAR